MQVAHATLNEDWLSRYTSDASAIRSFFDRNGDESELLRTAIGLVERVFSPAKPLAIEVVSDPEYDAEWLSIEAVVAGTTDEALNAYRQYVKEWVRVAPADRRSRIRLAYGVE